MSERSSSDYEDDEKFGGEVVTSRPWYSLAIFIAALAAIFLLGAVTFSKLLSDSRSGKVPNAPPAPVQGGSVVTAHCGTTPQEAQDRGCLWDIMSYGWIHPNCFDKEESARWEAEYGPWAWYVDRPNNETHLAETPYDQLPYVPVVWTTQGYHVVHCLYVLKMLHLAGMSANPVSNEGIDLGHTDHCVKLIGDPEYVDYDDVNTRVHLLFVQCVTLT